MKRMRCKIVIGAVLFFMAVGIILGVYRYVTNPDLNPPKGSVTLKAFVTEIHESREGESWRMYVTYDNMYDGIIPFDHSARIYDEKGKKISGEDIKAGDNLEILIDGTVIYEPVNTFHNCYRIRVLPEEPRILQEVQIFRREAYKRELVGSITGEEAQIMIQAVRDGAWSVGNTYRQNRLMLKVAGNILYYHPDEGVFFNEKKQEMMTIDSESKEAIEKTLKSYLDLQENREHTE